MNGETGTGTGTHGDEYDPEAEIIMDILRQINAELDEIAEKLEEIGKILGKKDHTTVMSGIDKIKGKLSSDEELKQNLDIIVKKLNPSS